MNFKNLKSLYLSFNKISDTKVLEKTNFEELEELYLNDNYTINLEV